MGPVTDAHKLTYQRNVQLAIQQKRSKFEPAFTYHSDLKGRQAQLLEQIGATEAILDGARGGDTPNIDANIEPVWVRPRQIEWGKLIEKEDAIKALTDYNSPFCQNGAAAIVRGRDGIFAGAIFGSRLIGQDGTTSVAWDNTNRLVASTVGSSDGQTATGMNVKKLVRALRLYEEQEVDVEQEQIFAAMSSQAIEELYYDITYVNKDYRDRAVLEEKRVREILGIKIIPWQRFTDYDASTARAAVWLKSHMHYGDFDPLTTSAEPNPAKKYRLHPYMENWFGSARHADVGVVELRNKK